MRGAGIRGIGGLALAALAAAGASIAGPGDDIMRRQPEPAPKKRRAPRAAARHGYSHYAYLPAGVNRHTGKPHEHRRAIARATTAPGTPERAAAMAAARVPSK